jgi:hypothetical protein
LGQLLPVAATKEGVRMITLFMAHQLGHKVTVIADTPAASHLLALLGVGTSIFLAIGFLHGY